MNRPTFTLVAALLAAPVVAPITGCYATVSFRATTAPQKLVEISPDVYVVYDYDQPVFYSSGSYWWWSSGTWYRSRYADSGWVVVHVDHVPVVVRRIDRPSVYVHYRGGGREREIPPGHVRNRYDDRGRGRGPEDRGDRGGGRGPEDRGDRGRDDRGRDDDHGRGRGPEDRGDRGGGRGPEDRGDHGGRGDEGRGGPGRGDEGRGRGPEDRGDRGGGRGPEDRGGRGDDGRGGGGGRGDDGRGGGGGRGDDDRGGGRGR